MEEKMRKIMLAGLVLAVVGMFGALRSAYCASVGAPGTQPGKFSIGLEEDYIFDRDRSPTISLRQTRL